jgi:protease I
VQVAAPEAGEIKSVPVDLTLDAVKVGDYYALVFPGGQMNPDTLRIKIVEQVEEGPHKRRF